MSRSVGQWPLHRMPYSSPEGTTTMSRYYKSIIAVVTAIAITTVQAVISAQADGQWTTEDTLVTLLAFLGAVAVYSKSNTPPEGQPSDPRMSETGHADLTTVLIALACAILVVTVYAVLI